MQSHLEIMNTLKFFAFLLVAVSCGVVVELREVPQVKIRDPWGPVREECREECGLSRADLAKAENDAQSVRTFLYCFGRKLKNLNEDGSVNREILLKNIAPMTPPTIAGPMLECCMDRVYKGQYPKDQHEAAVLFAEIVTCWKSLLPSSMWKIIGTFAPPVYPRLNKCQRRQWSPVSYCT